MDKSIHEEKLSQPQQTNIEQDRVTVNFLNGFNGIFNVTSKQSSIP